MRADNDGVALKDSCRGKIMKNVLREDIRKKLAQS
jgi:hypothetical protein